MIIFFETPLRITGRGQCTGYFIGAHFWVLGHLIRIKRQRDGNFSLKKQMEGTSHKPISYSIYLKTSVYDDVDNAVLK